MEHFSSCVYFMYDNHKYVVRTMKCTQCTLYVLNCCGKNHWKEHICEVISLLRSYLSREQKTSKMSHRRSRSVTFVVKWQTLEEWNVNRIICVVYVFVWQYLQLVCLIINIVKASTKVLYKCYDQTPNSVKCLLFRLFVLLSILSSPRAKVSLTIENVVKMSQT